jgi:hypothetical protein
MSEISVREKTFEEIRETAKFLDNWIYDERERIRVAIDLELLISIRELIGKNKGGNKA